jgi:rod shape determining protein RodA
MRAIRGPGPPLRGSQTGKKMRWINIDRRLIKNFDFVMLFLVLLLAVLSVTTIYSATRPVTPGAGQQDFYIKQIYWVIIGLFALFAVVRVDYAWFGRLSAPLYVAGLIMLLIVLIKGKSGMGAQRWLSLGPLTFQPSEFFRLFFIIMLSRSLGSIYGDIKIKETLGLFAAYALIPFAMLVKQPDLGTAAILILIFSALCLAKGMQKKAVSVLVMISIVSVPFLGGIFWEGLKDYQKNRLIAFMEPKVDPEGIGYHINQSKVAIGSGKFFGKGYLRGTQGPFRFLPEKHTDFVFSVFAEEWGFLGSIFILLIYLAIIMRGFDTAKRAKDPFGQTLATGITLMFSIYFFLNIGMTMGLMPVVGIPLPFMSYGGTALLSNFMAAGILINIRARRFELFY